ncbi:hypothetical protein [Poseidonibacter ostreae]|uniref:Uncharacterized protein n=1 Tax=Poseidonibacter ostreae TaxID=2654171 RepID=A0A6L4WX10_9BACT|nr:hypothetical protein [Poseidonibacter ostreae]KAB7891283.1 hypothetical protein GBG19_00170 [Poseidonibacter ostreae]
MSTVITSTNNKVAHSLKLKTEEILVKKTSKGNTFDDIDVIAINEWLKEKDGVTFFSTLRAIAMMCGSIDGFEELFFRIARELPSKLMLEDLSAEAINENFEDIELSSFTPMDYIKTIKKVMESSPKSREFLGESDDSCLNDSLKELNNKFKLIPMEEYKSLLEKQNTSEVSNENIFTEFANNLSFSRKNLREDYADEK